MRVSKVSVQQGTKTYGRCCEADKKTEPTIGSRQRQRTHSPTAFPFLHHSQPSDGNTTNPLSFHKTEDTRASNHLGQTLEPPHLRATSTCAPPPIRSAQPEITWPLEAFAVLNVIISRHPTDTALMHLLHLHSNRFARTRANRIAGLPTLLSAQPIRP